MLREKLQQSELKGIVYAMEASDVRKHQACCKEEAEMCS